MFDCVGYTNLLNDSAIMPFSALSASLGGCLMELSELVGGRVLVCSTVFQLLFCSVPLTI